MLWIENFHFHLFLWENIWMVFIHVFPIQMECDIQMIKEIWIHTNLSSLLSISHIGRWDPRQTKNWIREKVEYFIQKL